MKEYKQLFAHDPANGSYGDCCRTAIANILDAENLTDVPNFNEGDPDGAEFFGRVDEYLEPLGLFLLSIPFTGELSAVIEAVSCNLPLGQTWMIVGTSPRNFNHVVVVKNKVIYDPAEGGLIGPCDDGFYWVEFLARRSK